MESKIFSHYDDRETLDELLVQESAGKDEPVPAKTAAYKLTLLKKLSQSTRPSKIKETTDLLVVQGSYRDFLPILCALNLNHEGIRTMPTVSSSRRSSR